MHAALEVVEPGALALLLVEGDQTQVVDSVAYQDHEAEDDRSCGRQQDSGDWQLFDSLNPHNGTQEPLGTGCAPSPGVLNLCQPQVALHRTTLGSLKSKFR